MEAQQQLLMVRKDSFAPIKLHLQSHSQCVAKPWTVYLEVQLERGQSYLPSFVVSATPYLPSDKSKDCYFNFSSSQ